MSNVLVDNKYLVEIANAIRNKNGTENTYKPAKMAGAIEELPSKEFVKDLIKCAKSEIIIPNYVTAIGYGAFSYNQSLESVIIPDSVTFIGANAFLRCIKLTSITIPDSVTKIGISAFQNCGNLTSAIISNNVKTISDYAFNFCGLKSITIPDSVSSIGRYAFSDCSGLKSITIPNSVTNIGGTATFSNTVFLKCANITYVTLGDGFNANGLDLSATSKIERETVVNMFKALYDRTGLSAYTITLNKAVGDKLTDDDKAIATNKNWTIVYK